jgi:nicotinamide phosphoribosyltransferase
MKKYSSENLILKSDSYKFSHPFQFPEGMGYMHNYLEARGGDFPGTIFFGLQYILKKHFSNPISVQDVLEAEDFCKAHGVPFHKEGWMYIAKDLNGKLPIKIRSVPEGSLIPLHNILMSIESTDFNVAWLPGHLETILMQIWFPITVGTRSYYTRQIILDSLKKTSDNPEQEIDFKHHSFGYRGVSSDESAGIGGCAELIFSKGTDTIAGILCAMEYYSSDICGFSIPAAEHSTITSYGRDGEVEAYRNMIKQFGKPGGIFACVSDSFSIYDACEHIWGEVLRDEVIKSGATTVLRPDSGSPIEVVSKCLHILESKFGSTVNTKGYKVLNHNVRLIQGDGINISAIKDILERINNEGFSTTNIAFGQGGGSLQKLDRDTFKMAVKCSAISVNGELRDVFKDPITDKGKRSKKGRLDLICDENGQYQTVPILICQSQHPNSVMETVFENGEIKKEYTLDEIRERANEGKISLTGE